MSVQFVDDVVTSVGANTDELGHALERLSSSERMLRAQMFPLVRDVAMHPDDLRSDGCRSAASWLCMLLGMSHRSASQVVNVSLTIDSLPCIHDAFVMGDLSWDKFTGASKAPSTADSNS